MKNKLKDKKILIPTIIAIIAIIALVSFSFLGKPITYKPYNEFVVQLENNQIQSVYYTNASKINVKTLSGEIYETDNPRVDDFKEAVLLQGVNVLEQGYISPYQIIPIILLGGSIAFIIIMSVKNVNFGAKRIKSFEALEADAVQDLPFDFKSVAGNEEAKESVKDIVDFLKFPEKYSSYGARMPKGIILYGEPGTGKTLLAKAVAGEAGVPFYAVSGSDFVQVYVGIGASRIRQLFKKAKTHGKAVIFIDEIDAIGKKRSGGKTGGSDERDQTLNALLTEMSGFGEKEGIVVIAATNRLDMLDSALLRPGRFDRHIEVALPDVHAREKILALHIENKPFKIKDLHEWALKTSYFSGAKIEHLVNEAAILACKENSENILDTHLDKAFSIVVAGYEKKDRSYIKDIDRKITAYHEAGHALISLIKIPEDKVSKVTIIPSTKGAGGYTMSIPEDKLYHNKEYMLNRIMVLLGGRAAEEIIFGENKITTGASNDLSRTTSTVKNMVTKYGMGKSLGLLTDDVLENLSPRHQQDILDECKEITNSLYNETKKLLMENKDKLITISEQLLETETLNSEELQDIMKKSFINYSF
ncbi:ATP-dependent metallopeptidase FtsH/Yme1/Tma family protein [Clostridium sp. DL1XJH146]